MPADAFVLAVLLVDGRYALQLRDNKPGIEAPGMWGLFGGRIELGENASDAVVREVYEELAIKPPTFQPLWVQRDAARPDRIFLLFEADVSGIWGGHRLGEGQGVRCFDYCELAPVQMPEMIREVLRRHRRVHRDDVSNW